MTELAIAGFIPKSVSDWRGKIASVVMVPGCNFACPYCFSHQLIRNPAAVPKIPVSNVLAFLSNRANNVRAVIVTGGEPTLHGHRLACFLEDVQSLGLLTRIETNGSNPFLLRTLLDRELLDSVVLDIKAPLYARRYAEAVRKTAVLAKIRESIQLVMESGIDYEFRTVLVPGSFSLRDLQSICRAVRGAKRFVLHAFTPLAGTLDSSFESREPTHYDTLVEWAQTLTGIQEVRIKTGRGEETINPITLQAPRP